MPHCQTTLVCQGWRVQAQWTTAQRSGLGAWKSEQQGRGAEERGLHAACVPCCCWRPARTGALARLPKPELHLDETIEHFVCCVHFVPFYSSLGVVTGV